MARRQAVARHDDFLSESDLSPSSGEDDPAAARAPYNAVRDRAPASGSALRRPYRDEDDLVTGSSDAAAPGERRSAAPPILGSSEDESTDEDEEKLIGGGGEERSTTRKKGKKERRRWEMRSGAGAAATTTSEGGNTGYIILAIVVFVAIVCGVGGYYAYSQGMFGGSSDSDTTSGTSAVAGRTTAAATGGAAGATGAEDAATTAATTAHSSAAAASGASSDSASGSASGSASASGASASSAASGSAGSPDDAEYTLETITTTDDDGATQTLTGFESLATEGGSTVTTFIETDAAPTGGAKGDKHSGDAEDASSGVPDAVRGVASAIKSAGASGGGGDDDADEGMPRLDSETLVTTIDGKETTVRGLWKTELIGGSEPTSSFVVMTVGGDKRRRNSPWPAQTAPPVARLL
ncbi:hypothetical protein JCM9279_000689 [Rhodotorula babjevae]